MSMLPMTLGAHDAWNAMLFGESNQQTVNFLASQFETASNYVTGAASSFYNRAREMFNFANGSAAIDFARSVVSKVDNNFVTNRVQELTSLEMLRAASPVMQRWVMAEPTVRRRYFAQTCDGYSVTYSSCDLSIGDQHYDYRMVMSGNCVDTPDGGWRATTYMDELDPSDRGLTFGEKIAIRSTWNSVRGYLEAGEEDPTAPYGGKL